MFSKKPSKPQTQIDSLIGANTMIGGDLNFSGGLRVDGQVNGNVIATPGKPSTLVLSEHARVNGEVSVNRWIFCSYGAEGSIRALCMFLSHGVGYVGIGIGPGCKSFAAIKDGHTGSRNAR